MTVCSLIKSVERCALIFAAFRSTSASDGVSRVCECGAGRVHVSALLPAKSNAYLRARGGLIDHQPGEQVHNRSRLVSCVPQRSDPSSDISAITPLCLEVSADQSTPLQDPPHHPASHSLYLYTQPEHNAAAALNINHPLSLTLSF